MEIAAYGVAEEGIDTSLVRHVVIKLSTVNKLPIELGLQVFFMDESELVLDSLFHGDPVFLSSSEVDSEGKLSRASEDSQSIDLPAEKLGILEETEYLWIKARIVTGGSAGQFVKFYTDYTLDFEISFYAEFRINTREL